MAEDATTAAPMKPQETVIYILGELGGKMVSLADSVNASQASQAAINAANEAEHAAFRKTINEHATAIAVIQDGKKSQQETKITRLQQWSLWLGVPAAIATICGLLVFINLNH